MDEQAQFQAILSEYKRRLSLDPQIRAILRKLDKGKADFTDTSKLSQREADILGELLGGKILDVPAEGREALCTALLKAQHSDINDLLGEVQEALDEPLGVRLKPARAAFPSERVEQLAHSLVDPGVKPETIQRRADKPVATVAKSFHDDYIRINAAKRHDMGFKCYLNRVAVSGCCKWCTEVAGRYVYGDHPDDIFRRHDNCDCTVTFENGRQRQDVWSKRTWEAPAVGAGAAAPVRLSAEQAERLQEKHIHAIKGKGSNRFAPSVRMDTIVGGKPITEAFQKELSDEFDKFTSVFGVMNNVRSVTAYPYQNDGIWGAYNDNSYELFLFGSGGDGGKALLTKTAKQMRKDGKWSTSSVYHTFRHELGHALQERLGRTDPDYPNKIQEIEKIQKAIQNSLTNLDENDKIIKMKSTLSEYGILDNVDEFISECIAEYCDGKPRATAKSVVEILLKGGKQYAG